MRKVVALFFVAALGSCAKTGNQVGTSARTVEVCNNGTDNDFDGLIDCFDPDCSSAPACADVFACTKDFYETRDNDFSRVVTSTNPFGDMNLGSFGALVNAACYNTADGFIYAIRDSDDHLLRLKRTGNVDDLGAIMNLPDEQYYSGDCDFDNHMWIKNGLEDEIYRIDLGALPPVATEISTPGLHGADFAFDPTTNRIYGLSDDLLYIYNPQTNSLATRVVLGALQPGSHGAQWTDRDGFLYVYHNDTGRFRQIDVATGIARDIGVGSIVNATDGMRCALRSVPFEICGNGIDDDGDGVTDESIVLLGGNGCAIQRDTDGDGVPDADDLDDDNDGIPDAHEPGDVDGDDVPDRRDLDADDDGILDVVEAGHDKADADRDGTVDGPAGANGLPDAVETVPESGTLNYDADPMSPLFQRDTDRDGRPDFLDLDSDGDAASDLAESGRPPLIIDTDDNGVVNGPDLDGDGIRGPVDGKIGFGDDDTGLTLPNSDTDMLPDYRDVDRDGMSPFDIGETNFGGRDANNDGRIDTQTDNDNDGIADVVDDSDSDGIVDVNDTPPQAYGGLGLPDRDNDGIPNILDPDDDNDTVADGMDLEPYNPFVCRDVDSDMCDDCSVAGTAQPNNDGPDTDMDGICNSAPADGGVDGSTDGGTDGGADGGADGGNDGSPFDGDVVGTCTRDDECGGPGSGRICDTSTGNCVAGCRFAAGNGCPTGMICVSGQNGAGACVTGSEELEGGGCAVAAGAVGAGRGGMGLGTLGLLLAACLGRRKWGRSSKTKRTPSEPGQLA